MRAARFLVFALTALTACASNGAPDATPTAETGRKDEATEWYLRSVSDDGRTIAVVYTMSGVASDCEREGRVFAEESDDKVAVTAHKSVTLDRDRPCTEEFAYVDGTVALERPLGGRALVGCRPGRLDPTEDRTCRDLERSRQHGIFDFSPGPTVP